MPYAVLLIGQPRPCSARCLYTVCMYTHTVRRMYICSIVHTFPPVGSTLQPFIERCRYAPASIGHPRSVQHAWLNLTCMYVFVLV